MRISEYLNKYLELILPAQPAVATLNQLKQYSPVDFYHPATFEQTHTLTRFSNPVIQAAIRANKFHHHPTAIQLLAEILTLHLEQHPDLRTATWVPIPLSRARQRQRGYNQVEQIIRHCPPIAHRLHATLLKRTRDTTPQTGLSRSDRLQNVIDCFLIDTTNPPQHIVILDDVVTTGATMRAARAACASLSTRITCIALSH